MPSCRLEGQVHEEEEFNKICKVTTRPIAEKVAWISEDEIRVSVLEETVV